MKPKKPDPTPTVAKASLIIISIESRFDGDVRRSVTVRGNELAHQYVNRIADAMEAAVRAAIPKAKGEVRDAD